jgi:rRNA maturation protein Nop10
VTRKPRKPPVVTETCDRCGTDTKEYGSETCPRCGEKVCVQFCIPGGKGTVCIQCEGIEP